MNKLSNTLLNKINIVDALVIAAIILFLIQVINFWPSIDNYSEAPDFKPFVMFKIITMSVFSSIYNPAILLGIAKIIQLIEEKKNDVRN